MIPVLGRAATLAALLLAALPAAAERIRSFDVALDLGADGRFRVDERIVYDFEGQQRHGIYRDIPVRYGRGAAADYRIDLDLDGASDAAGHAWETRVSNEGRNRRIRIGSKARTVTGVREFHLRYRVRRGILWFDDHDELYWNATGTDWRVPIDAVRVAISLPEGAGSDVRFLCFTGRFGSVETACRGEQRGRVLHVEALRAFGPGEGLSVVVSLPKGVIAEPSAAAKALDRAGDWLSAATLLPVALFAGLWAVWWRWGRDPAGPEGIPVRYEPPDGLTPAEMGTVLDERADMTDITATILDLAVRGHLRIEEVTSPKFLFLSETDYRLHRGQAREAELKAHEQKILSGLFGGQPTVKLSSLRNEFYTRLPGIREALYEEVTGRDGYFPARPDRVRTGYAVAAFLLSIPLVSWGFYRENLALILTMGASAAVALFWSRHMPRKTRKGRRARQHILGFKEFVERVEKDRLERLGQRDIGHFERLLPFAFVLGAADAWAEAFADLYTEPPSWYVGAGDGPFRPRQFVSRVGRSLETAGSVMKSTPSRGSGSSGFSSGGGFSGGGFGGGGGGSW